MNDAQMTEALAQLAGVLWVLALVVLVLAAHVTTGYLRNGARAAEPKTRIVCGAAAALAWGTTLWAAMALGIASEGLGYPVGFAVFDLLGAWALAVTVAAVALLPLLRWQHGALAVASGIVQALGAVGIRGWLLMGIDTRPGLEWSPPALAVSALVGASGGVAGLWIGLRLGRRGRLRHGWRWAAALAMGGAAGAAQELTLAAVTLQQQRLSVNAGDVPLAAPCVLGALALPVALLLLELDLHRRSVLFDGQTRELRRERRRRRRAAQA